jgi:hypothetical protein
MTDMKADGNLIPIIKQNKSCKCVYINVIFYASVYEKTCRRHVGDRKWDGGVQQSSTLYQN